MRDLGRNGGVAKLPAFCGIDGQRLVRDNVLAGGEGGEGYGQVQVVRRGVMNNLDVRIGDQVVIAPVGAIDLVLGRLLLR
jgi:hypothetical protein